MSNVNEDVLEELRAIRKLLTIFSQDKLDEFNKNIESKYLTTEQRKQMYELFDGSNSFKEISKEVNVTAEGVRKFAVQLEKAGLVEMIEINAKQKNPKRLF